MVVVVSQQVDSVAVVSFVVEKDVREVDASFRHTGEARGRGLGYTV